MANYKLKDGYFSGRIVKGDTQILDIPFDKILDDSLREEILLFVQKQGLPRESDSDKKFAMELYEENWDCEETQERVTLLSISCDFNIF